MTVQSMDTFLEGVEMTLGNDGHIVCVNTASATQAQSEIVKRLDAALETAVQSALDAGCLKIQQALGIDAGDYAGKHFSGPDSTQGIRKALYSYMVAEIAYGQAVVVEEHTSPSVDPEVLPGATVSEIREVMMQDIVGEYEVPEQVPEWSWVERKASFVHAQNGKDGIWEFVLNMGIDLEDAPDKLLNVIGKAREDGIAYLIFHQGT